MENTFPDPDYVPRKKSYSAGEIFEFCVFYLTVIIMFTFIVSIVMFIVLAVTNMETYGAKIDAATRVYIAECEEIKGVIVESRFKTNNSYLACIKAERLWPKSDQWGN